MAEWSATPERRWRPTIRATSEGKIKLRKLTLALGLRHTPAYHGGIQERFARPSDDSDHPAVRETRVFDSLGDARCER